jgi:carboxypeptidase C (cathepsin A)
MWYSVFPIDFDFIRKVSPRLWFSTSSFPMAALRRWLANSLALATSFAAAQFPPTPKGITTKEVSSFPGVSISYKETCICETKAKAWAGYVHMPVSYLQDIEGTEPYNVSMFFWYFEAREDPQSAPTAMYLAGGPGQSSLCMSYCILHNDSLASASGLTVT